LVQFQNELTKAACTNLCADAEQYDNSQNQSSMDMEWELIEGILNVSFGTEGEDLQWMKHTYYALRRSMPAFGAGYSYQTKGEKTSGEPGTFFFNTLLMMGLWAFVWDERFLGGIFGGDDSFVRTMMGEAKAMKYIVEQFKLMNIEMKFDPKTLKWPIFFNCFYSGGKLIYDPIRLAASLLSKNWHKGNDKSDLAFMKEQ